MAVLKNVSLVVGIVLILVALVSKVSVGIMLGIKPISYLIAANTCFLLSLILSEKK